MIRLEYKTDKNLKARIQLHRHFSTNKYSWKKWIFDHLLMPGSSVALELGCGTGDLWTENMDRIPDDWRLSLSDFSPEMLLSAKRNHRSSIHRFSFELISSTSARNQESLDKQYASC